MNFLPESGAKAFKRLVVLLASVYLGACAFLYVRQTHIIFVPQREVEFTPKEFGCEFDELHIGPSTAVQEVEAGNEPMLLDAWYLPASGPAQANGKRYTIVYLHGNGGSIGANAEHACRLAKYGFNVFIFDYRGYGRSVSRGFPSEASVYEDAESALVFLTAAHISEKYSVLLPNLIFYGHSLGAAVAVEMARRHPDTGGLIIESAFTSLEDMSSETPQYRIFPIHWLLWNRMESIAKVPSLKMPVLIIHGLSDKVIPSFMSERLYAAAPQPKTLLLIPGAGHEDCAAVGGAKYSAAVLAFAASIPQRTSAVPAPPATASR